MNRLQAFGVVFLSILMLWGSPISAQPRETQIDESGDEIFVPPNQFPECMGPEDPFCPRGFPSDGGGDGGGGGTFVCQDRGWTDGVPLQGCHLGGDRMDHLQRQ